MSEKIKEANKYGQSTTHKRLEKVPIVIRKLLCCIRCIEQQCISSVFSLSVLLLKQELLADIKIQYKDYEGKLCCALEVLFYVLITNKNKVSPNEYWKQL